MQHTQDASYSTGYLLRKGFRGSGVANRCGIACKWSSDDFASSRTCIKSRRQPVFRVATFWNERPS